MAVAAALILLEHAEGDDGRGSPGAEDFPALLALASTCRALRAALQPRRAELAKTCWLYAFGAESLGACAAWQRIEQLGGSAFEARWRWLHGLRTSDSLTRKESVVEHELPTKAQLHDLLQEVGLNEFNRYFVVGEDRMSPNFWNLHSVALAAVDGIGGASLAEAFVATGEDFSARLTTALRSGAILNVQMSVINREEQHLVSFGGIAVELQGRGYDSVRLLDLTADAELHVLRRSIVPPAFDLPETTYRWAAEGTWSVDGTHFCVWGTPRGPPGVQQGGAADGITTAAYVFEFDAANAPPPGPLGSVHTLVLPSVESLAFSGGGDRLYTAEVIPDSTGVLRVWDIVTVQQLAEAPLTSRVDAASRYPRVSILVPFRSHLCVAVGSISIDVHSAETLQHEGRLERAPLLGGHGKYIVSMRGVADVLISCDENATVLAWHVPTRQLLHRLARNIYAAPPSACVFHNADALVLTSRGVAVLEQDFCRRSQTRLIDWLP